MHCFTSQYNNWPIVTLLSSSPLTGGRKQNWNLTPSAYSPPISSFLYFGFAHSTSPLSEGLPFFVESLTFAIFQGADHGHDRHFSQHFRTLDLETIDTSNKVRIYEILSNIQHVARSGCMLIWLYCLRMPQWILLSTLCSKLGLLPAFLKKICGILIATGCLLYNQTRCFSRADSALRKAGFRNLWKKYFCGILVPEVNFHNVKVQLFCAVTSPVTESMTEVFTELSTIDDYYYNFNWSFGETCKYEKHGATFLPVLYLVFFLLGLVGNSLAIWVTAFGTRLRSMTDVCLLNLAVADLLLVCSLPFQAHQAWDQWLFGDAMCKIILGSFNIAFYCGIFFVCLMSIDRYLAVVHAVYAMRARTRSFGAIAAAVTWMAGFLASFPDLLFLKVHPEDKPQVCQTLYPSSSDDASTDHSHFWSVFSLLKMNILGLLVPAIIIVFCYSQIICRLYRSRSSKKHAIRLVLVVVAVFFFTWMPYNTASFFKVLELTDNYTGCESSKAIILALQVSEAVAYSHSCLNPFLYVFVGEKFRRHLVRMISRTPCRLCQMIKVCLPQDRIHGSVYSQTTSLDERSSAV